MLKANSGLPFKLPALTPRYLFNTRRYLSLSVAIGAVALIMVVLGIIPQIQTTLAFQQKATTEGKKLASLEQKARQLEEILTPEILDQIDTVNILLPSKKPLLELLSSLNQIATQANVTFSGIELSPGTIASEAGAVVPTSTSKTKAKAKKGTVKSSATSDTLDVKLTVEGDLVDLNQFFELVERTAPLTTVTSLSLSPKNKALGSLSGGASRPLEERLGQAYEADLLVSAAYFTQSISAAIDAQLPALSQSQQTIVAELATFSVQPFQKQPTIQGGGLQDLFGIQQSEVEVSN